MIKNQVATRLTHEGRTTPPRLTRPFFRVVDEVLCKLRVAHVCGGIDPYDNDFDARRVGLPVRAKMGRKLSTTSFNRNTKTRITVRSFSANIFFVLLLR